MVGPLIICVLQKVLCLRSVESHEVPVSLLTGEHEWRRRRRRMIVECQHHHSCMHERATTYVTSSAIADIVSLLLQQPRILRSDSRCSVVITTSAESTCMIFFAPGKKCSSGSLEPFYSLHLGLHRFVVNASISLSFAHQYSSPSSLDMPPLFPTDNLNRLA